MRKLRLFDWLKIIQRFGGLPSPVPFPPAPDSGLPPGLGWSECCGADTPSGSREVLGGKAGARGWQAGGAPAGGNRRWNFVPLVARFQPWRAEGRLAGSASRFARMARIAHSVLLRRSRADPGVLFPSGRNLQTYPLYEVQFRETFFPSLVQDATSLAERR